MHGCQPNNSTAKLCLFHMSYHINLQHIIFRTGSSKPTIPQKSKIKMLSYINSVSNDMGVKIIRINAYENHVHILADVPVGILLSEYVRKIKQTSSAKFRRHIDFPFFDGWGRGYGSFSVSHYERERIINYIKGQDEHHRVKSFSEELESLFGHEWIVNDRFWHKNWIE